MAAGGRRRKPGVEGDERKGWREGDKGGEVGEEVKPGQEWRVEGKEEERTGENIQVRVGMRQEEERSKEI